MEMSVEHLGSVQFEIKTRGHAIVSDQPLESGGFDEGMTHRNCCWRRWARAPVIMRRNICARTAGNGGNARPGDLRKSEGPGGANDQFRDRSGRAGRVDEETSPRTGRGGGALPGAQHAVASAQNYAEGGRGGSGAKVKYTRRASCGAIPSEFSRRPWRPDARIHGRVMRMSPSTSASI